MRRRKPSGNAGLRALLAGKTVGILGVGLIAEYLAPICKTFGMTVIGISGSPRETKAFDRMAHRNDLAKVAGELDFLVVLTPSDARNARHRRRKDICSHEADRLSGERCARRSRREPALIAALEAGKIAGAGLDVFSQEPLPSNNPLWKTKNVTIFSHLGGYSQGYEDRAMPTIAGNMAKFLAGDLQIHDQHRAQARILEGLNHGLVRTAADADFDRRA